MRGVPGLDGDVEDRRVRRQQAVGRAFEQHPAAELSGCLARGGRDHPIEVEARQVEAAGQIGASRHVVVQHFGQYGDERGEGVGPVVVGQVVHGAIVGRPAALRLIAFAVLRASGQAFAAHPLPPGRRQLRS